MADLDAAELEHIIGFTGQDHHALTMHPRDPNILLHGIGHVVVLADQVNKRLSIGCFQPLFDATKV